MASTNAAVPTRQVYLHDSGAPAASIVAPSVFVAAFGPGRHLLLVRRCDTGRWELPGGRVDVGETAVGAAVREVWEESGVRVRITGLVGLFTDPGHVVRAPTGEVRQPFEVVFRAVPIEGMPRGDFHETSDAAWVALTDLAGLPIESAAHTWIRQALDPHGEPYLG